MNDAIAATAADVDSRFRTLVQSPLRAGLLRFLAARPDDTFDVDALMAAFGRMRLDVQNCVRELVDFGVARRINSEPPRFMFARPSHPDALRLVDTFLERRAAVSTEDQSPVGPALPRDDRPRREDARRLRVDPHRREVGHLGADPRPDRIRAKSSSPA